MRKGKESWTDAKFAEVLFSAFHIVEICIMLPQNIMLAIGKKAFEITFSFTPCT